MNARSRRYRVVQWATGNVGARALRGIVEHRDLDLAGVYVHTPEKAGRDAGELCGLDHAGVIATGDIDEIVALRADCVIYTPRIADTEQICRLLASGANIVTTRSEFLRAGSLDPVVRRRIDEACDRGGTSIHSTGSSPGFVTEALPLVLTSIQRRLDGLTIEEFADLSHRDSPALLFDVMGFGKPPAAYDERRVSALRNSFGPSLHLVADALSARIDSIEAVGEVATARRQVRIAAGVLQQGTVAAQRITVSGIQDGRPLLRFRATWYCTADLNPLWDVRATGWHVQVEGDAPLDVDVRFPVPLESMAAVSPSYTANRAVNAVPFVCAAPSGIRTTADLPTIVAMLG